jgi:hypothetical protein
MAEYYCLFKRGPTESSDAAVNTVPVESTKVLGQIERTDAVLVEAASSGAAAQAARSAYPGRANKKIITVLLANWVEN